MGDNVILKVGKTKGAVVLRIGENRICGFLWVVVAGTNQPGLRALVGGRVSDGN